MKKVDSFENYAVEEQFTAMTEEVMQGTVGGCSTSSFILPSSVGVGDITWGDITGGWFR